MDYRTAQQHFTKRSPLRRRLDGHNNTWLHRQSTDEGTPIHVRLFRTDIITFRSNGSFVIDTSGYITPTTKDRFRRYLPKGCNVSSERLHDGKYIMTLRTPKGYRPLRDGAWITKEFSRVDLTAMNSRVAYKVRDQIRDYAKSYVQQLVSTGLPAPCKLGDCMRCIRELRARRKVEVVDPDCTNEDHYLEHLDNAALPASLLLNAVLYEKDSQTLWDAANALFTPNRCLWRLPRIKREALEQTEAELMGRSPMPIDPRRQRVDLRNALERFLLERVGFEAVEPQGGLSQGMHRNMKAAEVMGWR